MIFKYYNSELTGLTNNLGFNQRSFADWGKQVSASFTQAGGGLKGFVNAIGTAFVAPKSSIKLIESNQFSSLFNLNTDEFFAAFNNATFKSTEKMYEWCDSIKVTDITMRSYLEGCMRNKVPATFEGYNAYVQAAKVSTDQLTTSAKLTQIAFKGLSMIGSILAPMLIVTAITKFVQGLKWLTEAEERAIEKSKKLREEFESFASENSSNRKTIEGLRKEYEELSKGLDENGNNISLSADEYGRYQDIVSQILDINPQLITGWNEQGQAITSNNNLIQESINLLDEEYQKKLRNATTKSANKEISKGVIEEINEYKNDPYYLTKDGTKYNVKKGFYDALKKAESKKAPDFSLEYNMAEELYDYLYPNAKDSFYHLTNGFGGHHNKAYGYFWDILEIIEKNDDFDEIFLNSFSDENNPIYQWLDSDIIDTMIENAEEYKGTLVEINDELEALYQPLKDQINYGIQSVEGYAQLSASIKSFINEYVNELDYSEIKTPDDFQNTFNDAKDFVQTLLDDSKFRIKVNDLYSLETKDLSTDEYISAYRTILEDIQSYATEHGIEIPSVFSENINELETQYDNIIDKATEKFAGTAYSDIEELQEKYEKAVDKRQTLYSGENKVGNVDLYNRPVVVNDDGTYSTVFTEFEKFANGDGTYSMVYYTPYLPNGELLDRSTLEAYINQLLNSDDPIGFDAGENGYKILYKVETTTKDGKPITNSNLETAYNEGNTWAENIHKEQHVIYGEEAQYKIQLEQANRVKKRIEDFTKQQEIITEVERQFWYECLESESTLQQAMSKYLNSNIGGVSYNDYASNIQSLSNGLDPLGEIYLDMTDDDNQFDYSAFLNNEDFKAYFDDFKDEYNEFIKVISSSNGKLTSEGQQAFNKLADAFIKNKANLEDVTQETKATTIEQLKQMGVTNAEALVTDVLAQKERNLAVEKEKLRLETKGVTISSKEEYEALIKEAQGNEIAKIAITQLWLQKMAVNGVKIDTSADIEAIYNLATTALAGTQALAELARAKQVLGAVEKANGDLEAAGVANWEYYDALNTLEKLKNGTYEFNFNQIDLKNTTVDFARAQEKAADATDKVTDALEKEKSKLEDIKDEYDLLYDAVMWFYDKQIEKIDDKIDALNEENERLQEQQENMDRILAAIEANYDAEIKLIQDKIDALKDENDEEERALALEEAKRKLQEAKSRKTLMVYQKGVGFTYQVDTKAITEAEEELEELQENEVVAELEKQIEKLEEAKNKWSEIPEAYEKAMQEIAAKNYFGKNWKDITLNPSDSLLNKFEGKYTGIQSSIDKNEGRIERYEKEKEKIEELKKAWEDAKNAYQYYQYETKLAEYFGSDYEYQLLNNSKVWRQQYAEEYSNLCAQIEALEQKIKAANDETANAATTNAQTIKTANEETVKSAEALSNSVSQAETATGSVVDAAGAKVDNISQVINTLKDAIFDLITNINILYQTMTEIDSISLGNLMAQFGAGSSNGSFESGMVVTGVMTKPSEGSEESASGGSGLLGAINAVIDAVGKIDSADTTSLIGALNELNNTELKGIIDKFGISGDNGATEGSLLSAINNVSNTITGEGNVESGLIPSIKELGSDATSGHIFKVQNSFHTLMQEITSVIKQVDELTDKINSIPKVSSIGNTEGTGTAFTFATGTAFSGNAYASGTGKWGLSSDKPGSLVAEQGSEIIVRDGKYRLISSPTLMNLKKGDIVFNHKQTEAIMKNGSKPVIDKIANKNEKIVNDLKGFAFAEGTIKEKIFEAIMNGISLVMNPKDVIPKFAQNIKKLPENSSEQKVEIHIGDIHVHGVDNVNDFADDILKYLPNALLQKINKK